jgi:hypothetical protein
MLLYPVNIGCVQGLKLLVAACHASVDTPFILPNQPVVVVPGGSLVHAIKQFDRMAEIDCLAITADGATVATSSRLSVVVVVLLLLVLVVVVDDNVVVFDIIQICAFKSCKTTSS